MVANNGMVRIETSRKRKGRPWVKGSLTSGFHQPSISVRSSLSSGHQINPPVQWRLVPAKDPCTAANSIATRSLHAREQAAWAGCRQTCTRVPKLGQRLMPICHRSHLLRNCVAKQPRRSHRSLAARSG